MLLAQLSDLHAVPSGRRMAGVVDTNGSARRTVEHVNRLHPPPDAVVVTGDVTDDGSPEAYAEARSILDQLTVPYHVIPGNHDRRGPFLDAFADRCASEVDGRFAHAVDLGELRLVLLDTLVEGREEGALGAAQLAWLDATLGAPPDRPTMLCLHHPPFDTGVWWMDTSRLADSGALASVVARHPNVVHAASGHVHRSIHRPWAGTTGSIAPSTAYAIDLDLGHEAPPRAVLAPPACHLHAFDGDHVLTHVSVADDRDTVVDLTAFIGDWEDTRRAWRARRAGLR